VIFGPDELRRRGRRRLQRELLRQFTHPLPLLLWLAAALAYIAGTLVLAEAIIAVIVLNAVLAFVHKQQAERAARRWAPTCPRTERSSATTTTGRCRLPRWCPVMSPPTLACSMATSRDMSALTGESTPARASRDPPTPGHHCSRHRMWCSAARRGRWDGPGGSVRYRRAYRARSDRGAFRTHHRRAESIGAAGSAGRLADRRRGDWRALAGRARAGPGRQRGQGRRAARGGRRPDRGRTHLSCAAAALVSTSSSGLRGVPGGSLPYPNLITICGFSGHGHGGAESPRMSRSSID
jgi:hypothetical protein